MIFQGFKHQSGLLVTRLDLETNACLYKEICNLASGTSLLRVATLNCFHFFLTYAFHHFFLAILGKFSWLFADFDTFFSQNDLFYRKCYRLTEQNHCSGLAELRERSFSSRIGYANTFLRNRFYVRATFRASLVKSSSSAIEKALNSD